MSASGQRASTKPVEGARSVRAVVADINLLARAAGFAPHGTKCEGWYRCTCWVARAERAADRLRADARASSAQRKRANQKVSQ